MARCRDLQSKRMPVLQAGLRRGVEPVGCELMRIGLQDDAARGSGLEISRDFVDHHVDVLGRIGEVDHAVGRIEASRDAAVSKGRMRRIGRLQELDMGGARIAGQNIAAHQPLRSHGKGQDRRTEADDEVTKTGGLPASCRDLRIENR